MKKVLMALATTAAMAAAVPANAALIVTINPGGMSGSFVSDAVVCTGTPCSFAETANFFNAGFTLVSASVSNVATGSSNIDFTVGANTSLNGLNFNFAPGGTGVTNETGFVNNAAVLNPNTLKIAGVSTGGSGTASYSGTLSFVQTPAVPEPATWALMILGFGAVGYSMRRRPTTRFVQAA